MRKKHQTSSIFIYLLKDPCLHLECSAMARNMPFFLLRAVVCLFLSTVLVQSAPQSALVRYLPGFKGRLQSNQYSGYVDIGNGKNLFYYFVVSERKPSEDPVVLWLNGGPGCSSFDGFVYEHGPFNFAAGKPLPRLSTNPNSWSKVSNIIYLDSPVGVGLSYSLNKLDYVTGDLKTAKETYKFLLEWFALYPEFQSNRFFIAGESYAGVYVPMLASEVLKGNNASSNHKINLKGYLVGNGVTDEHFDGNALVPFAHGMGLISDELYEDVKKECKGHFYDPQTKACDKRLSKVYDDIDDLNLYNILEPCYHGKDGTNFSGTRIPTTLKNLGKTDRPLPVRKRMFGRAWPFRALVRQGLLASWPELAGGVRVPCIDDTVATSWLNNDAVRNAIHAQPVKPDGRWELCTSKLNYTSDGGSMMKYHKSLTTRGIRALIYSGDHDMCIPFTGTEAWTKAIGYHIVDEWRPWGFNGQVAGYIQSYAHNLTFMTVKGAGHTVPEYKPREAFHLFSQFLEGKRM